MTADWHSNREPEDSTRRFADGAAFERTMEGPRAALEVTVFEDGTVYLVSSKIVPQRGERLIVMDTALMCQDVNEAKDAVDLILDRLESEATR